MLIQYLEDSKLPYSQNFSNIQVYFPCGDHIIHSYEGYSKAKAIAVEITRFKIGKMIGINFDKETSAMVLRLIIKE